MLIESATSSELTPNTEAGICSRYSSLVFLFVFSPAIASKLLNLFFSSLWGSHSATSALTSRSRLFSYSSISSGVGSIQIRTLGKGQALEGQWFRYWIKSNFTNYLYIPCRLVLIACFKL